MEETNHPIGVDGLGNLVYANCIGGEDVGWCAYEERHMNETSMTYSFQDGNAFLLDENKADTHTAASRWSGTVNFQYEEEGGAIEITMINTMPIRYDEDGNEIIVYATTEPTQSGVNGHPQKWKITLNYRFNADITPGVIAHEFGHVIGLNDLYESQNSNKLMYYSRTENTHSPTSSDRWGAKVITGQHTSHTWGYKYHSTTTSGSNRHVNYCTSCNGFPAQKTISNCIYNANNVCRLCGTPAGQQPWSVPHETE
ncbi:MAG: hypothetical protein IJB47_04850 [Oscillospiraceae bacterium]|nr:hypothetical protein [Oscillospiraceae bacterium]